MKIPKQSTSFKTKLQNHYELQTLSESQVNTLQALSFVQEESKSQRSMKPLLAIASSLLIGISFYIINFTGLNYDDISQEIAYNHNNQMQMEVFSDSIHYIQSHLNRLDFSLAEPAFLEGQNWKLVGGRYCSINGKIAAQLQIKNIETSDIYTFYQAKLPDPFLNIIQDKAILVDGVEVKMWQEDGLLMGLAQ